MFYVKSSVGLSNEVTSVKATADSRYALISLAPDVSSRENLMF
jgi:hypothetical protein